MDRLEARLKQETRYGSMQFFSRHEYVKHEWRSVPAGYEDQASANEYLELRSLGDVKEVIEQAPSKAIAADVDMGTNDDDAIIDDILSGVEDEAEEAEAEDKPKRTRRATKKD